MSRIIRATRNPIIPGRGVCDPHIHVFGDRAWLFASHDRDPGNPTWLMHDWQIWSSADLVEWRHESTVRPEDTYIGPSDACWAVDAAQRNGRYYLYFSNRDRDTGVAVADHPAGPYRDALGRPLLPAGLTASHQYDPTVFIDDDEARTPYLVWGSYRAPGYHIARLNEDMVSLAEPPQPMLIDGGPAPDDKSFLHKHDGWYYLSWGSFYAVSRHVRGPYHRIPGRTSIGVSHDHGSFFAWHGQWFNAFTIFDPTCFHRASGLCYLHYDVDGSMHADQLIVEHGVARYDARWNQLMACWYLAGDGIRKRRNHWERFEVSCQRDGAWLRFPNLEHLGADPLVTAWAVCGNPAGAVIEFHRGHPDGELLGRLAIPATGTWNRYDYRSHTTGLRLTAGTADLCLVIRGGTAHAEGELLRLESLRFHRQA